MTTRRYSHLLSSKILLPPPRTAAHPHGPMTDAGWCSHPPSIHAWQDRAWPSSIHVLGQYNFWTLGIAPKRRDHAFHLSHFTRSLCFSVAVAARFSFFTLCNAPTRSQKNVTYISLSLLLYLSLLQSCMNRTILLDSMTATPLVSCSSSSGFVATTGDS